MDVTVAGPGAADGAGVSRRRAIAVGVVQLLLAVPLAITAFGFPLWLTGASAVILTVLWVLGTVFDRTAGP